MCPSAAGPASSRNFAVFIVSPPSSTASQPELLHLARERAGLRVVAREEDRLRLRGLEQRQHRAKVEVLVAHVLALHDLRRPRL